MARRAANRRPLDSRWDEVVQSDTLGRPVVRAVPRYGETFGSLFILVGHGGKGSKSVCRCSCGAEVEIETRRLMRETHPRCRMCSYIHDPVDAVCADIIADPDVRDAWLHRYTGMVSRCTDKNHRAYPNYGGRGITIHPEWLADRRAFLLYAITLPNWDGLGYDMDRERNEGNYEPGNIRLVTRTANARNRRNTARITHGGVEYDLCGFAESFCPLWSRNTVRYHAALGRSGDWIVDFYRATRGGVRPD